MEVIRHDGTEKALQDWLRPILAGPHVGSKLRTNNNETSESVLLFRTGGTEGTIRTDRPVITVEARAATEQRADELLGLTRGLILAAGRDGLVIGGRQIHGVVSVGGVGNLPDPTNRQPRYTWTCEIHIAGVVTEVTF